MYNTWLFSDLDLYPKKTIRIRQNYLAPLDPDWSFWWRPKVNDTWWVDMRSRLCFLSVRLTWRVDMRSSLCFLSVPFTWRVDMRSSLCFLSVSLTWRVDMRSSLCFLSVSLTWRVDMRSSLRFLHLAAACLFLSLLTARFTSSWKCYSSPHKLHIRTVTLTNTKFRSTSVADPHLKSPPGSGSK